MAEKKKYSILIIEDELIVAENIAHILEQAGYQVAGISDNADEALYLFSKKKPHLVVCDIHIRGHRDGIEAAKAFYAIEPVPFLYLTAYADDATLKQAAETDFDAYLLKPFVPAQLTVAIKLALDKFYGEGNQPAPASHPGKRETEILQLIAAGKSSAEIADQLHLSIHTVNTHRKNLLNKYDVQSSSELIAFAIKQRWI